MAFNKQKALKVVNPVVAALFAVQATGGFLHDAIPYEIFEKMHGAGGLLLTAGIVTHVVLNWSWFRTAFAKKRVK